MASLGAAVTLDRFGVPAARPPAQPVDRATSWTTAQDRDRGEVRITALGTSLTSRNRWPELLPGLLAGCLADSGSAPDVSVEIVASPGASSSWGLQQLDRVEASAPDLVLIEFAVNDSALHRGMPLASSRSTHERLLDQLLDRLPQTAVVLVTTNPAIGVRGAVRPGLGSYYAMYRELAEQEQVGLVDLEARWAVGGAGPLDDALVDGLHPTATTDERFTAPAVAGALCP